MTYSALCSSSSSRPVVLAIFFLGFSLFSRCSSQSISPTNLPLPPSPPQLNGATFRVTVVEQPGFIDVIESPEQDDDNGNGNGNENDTDKDNTDIGILHFSGYLVEVLQAMAHPSRANMTLEFVTPSGMSSLCNACGEEEKEVVDGGKTSLFYQQPYSPQCRSKYGCATTDVTDTPRTNYTTDMYLGMFYMTPERQLRNQFTIPLYPPTTGTLTMFGTATHIQDMEDFVQQQMMGIQGPACVAEDTAYPDFLRQSFPNMTLVECPGTDEGIYLALQDGICDVVIVDHPLATQFVLARSLHDECIVNDKPIGVIGEPLGFGLNYYAVGIRLDIPLHVVETMNYWLNRMMTCSPQDCGNASLAKLYPANGGTGRECGYVQFPLNDGNGLSPQIVAGIVFAVVASVAILTSLIYKHKLRKQEQRYKKRFVQQIARNINIGPSPSCIPVDKLAEEVQHIGNSEGVITKPELLQWMLDVKLEFISDRDFDALWSAMDPDNKGEVNAIDFFVFLSACGSQFEEVYQEQQGMPKTERLKLAARRLSNINRLGESGVRKMELRLSRGGGSTGFGGGSSATAARRSQYQSPSSSSSSWQRKMDMDFPTTTLENSSEFEKHEEVASQSSNN